MAYRKAKKAKKHKRFNKAAHPRNKLGQFVKVKKGKSKRR